MFERWQALSDVEGATYMDRVRSQLSFGGWPVHGSFLFVRYDDKNDFFKQQPDKSSYDQASKCKVKGYAHVAQDLTQMKAGLPRFGQGEVFWWQVGKVGKGLLRPLYKISFKHMQNLLTYQTFSCFNFWPVCFDLRFLSCRFGGCLVDTMWIPDLAC